MPDMGASSNTEPSTLDYFYRLNNFLEFSPRPEKVLEYSKMLSNLSVDSRLF